MCVYDYTGVEPFDEEVIKKPPRNPRQPIFNSFMIASILASALLMVTGTLFVFYTFLDVSANCLHVGFFFPFSSTPPVFGYRRTTKLVL